jgi:uncharacterized protein with ParB-like and HNH nuclease domain
MTNAQIHGKEFPIQDIFCEKFVFHIPRYQRPYSWELEQAQTLLDDLLGAIGNLEDSTDDLESYFLGSIVVVKEENKPEAEVVDGQQRLTTLTILLAAIRASFESEEARQHITHFIYHKGNPLTKTPDHYHLTLRERDAEFFQNNVQKDVSLEKVKGSNIAELSDSQANIVANSRQLLDMLEKYTDEQLSNLASYILTQCYLIVVSTPTVESAYRIFSVLNDRGLDLSHSDIFKAEIIGEIEKHHQDAYSDKWEDVEDAIGRDAFKELFTHIRTIHRKAKLKESILKEVREYVLKKYLPKELIDSVIVPYAKAFDVIRTTSYQSAENAEDVNRILKWLLLVDNFDWVPAALAGYNSLHDKPIEFLDFLVNLERLAASMMIRRVNINLRIIRYGRLLTAMENGSNLYAPDSPLQLDEAEIKDTADRLDGDIYNLGPRVYILRRLDAELSENKHTPDLPIYTVEHVLPQNPEANSLWLKWYPEEDIRKSWLNRLGNLALLSKRRNASARNFEFEKKKNLYFKSPSTPFVMTVQILNQPTWTLDVLKARHKENLAVLKKLWRLETLQAVAV